MAVKSPCIELCAFDNATGYCVGCLRTLDEARQWKKMTDFKRHQIVNDAKRRKTKVRPAPAGGDKISAWDVAAIPPAALRPPKG